MDEEKLHILIGFSKNLRLRRLELHLTQEQLSEKSGLHINFIGDLERCKKMPTLQTLIKLSKSLEISVSKLIGVE